MSSYVNFYLRINDFFVPIGDWSRSSEMYQAWQSVLPYEKIKSLDSKDILKIVDELKFSIQIAKEKKEKNKVHIKMIMDAANTPLDEKLEHVIAVRESEEEINEYIDEINFAINTLRVFLNMIDAFKYSDNNYNNDSDHYIYAGIEADGKIENII